MNIVENMEISRSPFRISRLALLVVFSVLLSATGASVPVAAQGKITWSSAYEAGEQALSSASPDKAVVHFRKAVELARKQSRNSSDLDKCQLKLASALTLLDRTAEARAISRGVLDRLEKKYGPKSPKTAPVLMTLGSIEESAGDHSAAMSYYNQALSITEKNYGPYSPVAASALHGIGRVHGKTGNREEAVTSYKRAISILSKEPNLEAAKQLEGVTHDYADLLKGEDDSNRDLIKDFNADILQEKNDSQSSAEQSYQSPSLRPALTESQWQKESQFRLQAHKEGETDESEQVALRGLHLPSSDRTLAPAYKIINDTISDQSRYGKGEAQYKRMIAIDIDSLGPRHPSVGNDLSGLAQLYMSQGEYQKAQPLLLRALSIYEEAYGAANILSISTRAMLASAEFHLGNIDKASSLYQQSLSQSQQALGPNNLETAKILNDLAYLYFHQGQLEKSRTFYEWAVASTERAVGEDNPLLAACLKDYAQVLRRLGKNGKATATELRAGKILAAGK